MSTRVIVTRPARDALRWVADLRAAGCDAVALPLIAIEPLHDPVPLQAAAQRVNDYDALMFVSAAAAEHFFDATGKHVVPAARLWATGPGTVRALANAGMPSTSIDAPFDGAGPFDSEALWDIVRTQVHAGWRVLIVRGADVGGRASGRDWLAREIAAAGGIVDTVAAYRRLAPSFGDDERRLASAASDGSALWLFSSSEAIGNLCRAMPGTAWRSARAIATHERIGDAARAAGFGDVRVSPPSLSALLASIESSQ